MLKTMYGNGQNVPGYPEYHLYPAFPVYHRYLGFPEFHLFPEFPEFRQFPEYLVRLEQQVGPNIPLLHQGCNQQRCKHCGTKVVRRK